MLFILVQLDFIFQHHHLAVYFNAQIAVMTQFFQFVFMAALGLPAQRAHDGDAGVRRQLEDFIRHLPNGHGGNGNVVVGAVRRADAGIKKPQIIVYFRNRADGGAGIIAGGFLIDGDGRTQAVDAVNIRLVDIAQKLAGISRQGFNIAALAFRIDGVKGQGCLAAAGQAGHDNQLVAGQFQTDIL